MKRATVTKFNATVELHCNSGGRDPERAWSITINDEQAGGIRVIEVEFTHEQMAHLLANRPIGYVHDEDDKAVPATLYVSERIGKREEYAAVVLPIGRDDWDDRDVIVRRFRSKESAPSGGTWANDRWTCDSLPDRPNPHKFTDDGKGYRSMMRRWLPIETDTAS